MVYVEEKMRVLRNWTMLLATAKDKKQGGQKALSLYFAARSNLAVWFLPYPDLHFFSVFLCWCLPLLYLKLTIQALLSQTKNDI